MHLIIKSSNLILILSFLFSCGEDQPRNLERLEKELIFNELNVDQPRGHFAFIQENINFSDEENDHVSVGLASRSSGRAAIRACPLIFTSENDTSQASGSLTSSTRFTTALHPLVTDKNLPIIVTFGASGKNVSDPDILNLSWIDSQYRYTASEDEPLLPMRLFQLGLKEWAVKNAAEKTRREWLRQWIFEFDTIGGGFDFQGQEFALVDNYRVVGTDIVVLKVVRNAANNVTDTFFGETPPRSGLFPIDRPGVFFDHIYFDVKEPEIADPLWLTHTTQWPTNNHKPEPLISRPGYALNSVDVDDFREFDNICGDPDLPHLLFDLQGLTTDSKLGSSGGSVFANNKYEFTGRPDISYMAASGVQTGALWGDPRFDNNTWQSAGPIRLDEPNPDYDGFNTNFFTAIDQRGVDITSRDPGGPYLNTGDPKPCSEGESGNCLPCEHYDSNDNCDIFTYTESDTGGGNGNLPINPRGIAEDDQSSQETRIGDRRVNCMFDVYGKPYTSASKARGDKMYPGVIVGLMGSSVGKFNKEDGVGSFYAICAPLSSQSYTDNWQFLTTKGSVLPGPNIRGYVGWGSLNLKSHDTYTIQEQAPRGHKYRPVPMKFCPPNYIMYGLQMRVTTAGVTGLVGLHCKQSSNFNAQSPAGEPTITVKLDASASGVAGYTLYGAEYTLDQRIGNVSVDGTTGNGVIVNFICPQDGFLSGLEMSHDTHGIMDKFHPYCIPHPL